MSERILPTRCSGSWSVRSMLVLMAIRKVRLLGDPVLRSKCNLVDDPVSPAIRIVADDLRDTFSDLKKTGAYGGLSAPQIGAPIQLIYIVLEGPIVMVNPEIVDIGADDFLYWDLCASFSNLLVRVQRAFQVVVRYQDLEGKTCEVEAEGPQAQLLQHEIDHLDGLLAIDLALGFDPFCLREEWDEHHSEEGRHSESYPRIGPAPPEFRF